MTFLLAFLWFQVIFNAVHVQSAGIPDPALSEVKNKTTIVSPSCAVTDLEKSNFDSSPHSISQKKCGEFVKQLRILNEREEQETVIFSDFPNMGLIGWESAEKGEGWVFKCGCSLISSKFVLTVAHCTRVWSGDITVTDPLPKIVRLGVNIDTHNTQRKDYKIFRSIVHPQYKVPKKYFDVALLELDTDVEFTPSIHPACLWNSFDTACIQNEVITAGLEVSGSQLVPVGGLKVLDQQECDNLTKKFHNRLWSGLQEHQICANSLSENDDTHCKLGTQEDQAASGGPLQIRIPNTDPNMSMFYQIGVTSYGFNCKIKNNPLIYLRVSSFIDWIENIVWQK